MKALPLLALFLSSTAMAQVDIPEPPAIPPGADEIAAVTARAPSPMTGMVLSTDTAIRWTNALRWWPETFRLRMEHAHSVFEARLEHAEARRTIEVESLQRELSGLRRDIRAQAQRYEADLAVLRNPPFRQTRAFGFISGIVLTVVLVAATAVLVLAL